MIYDEVATGGSRVAGCASDAHKSPVFGQFAIGDTAYSVAKARRGILEKIVIKNFRSVASKRTSGSNRVLYVDPFNGLWNEHDLVTGSVAQNLVSTFLGESVEKAAGAELSGSATVAGPVLQQIGPGDILYDAAKARRGILEKIVIKKVRPHHIYQDSFNGFWNEWDLVPLEQAVELAQAFLLALGQDFSKLKC